MNQGPCDVLWSVLSVFLISTFTKNRFSITFVGILINYKYLFKNVNDKSMWPVSYSLQFIEVHSHQRGNAATWTTWVWWSFTEEEFSKGCCPLLLNNRQCTLTSTHSHPSSLLDTEFTEHLIVIVINRKWYLSHTVLQTFPNNYLTIHAGSLNPEAVFKEV